MDKYHSFWKIKFGKNSKKYSLSHHKGKTYHFKVILYNFNTLFVAWVRALDNVIREEFEP